MYEQLDDYIRLQGYNFNAKDLTLNGEIQNLTHENFKGWYVGSIKQTSKGHQYATLTFEDFRSGERFSVSTDKGKVSKEELSRIEAEQRQEKARIEKEVRERQTHIAERARKAWHEFETASTISGYCEKKKIGEWIREGTLLGAKVIPDGTLIIPTKDIEGKIWGYQTIDAEGQKLFLDGQKTDEVFFRIGNLDPSGVVYICEGFATGVSIHVASGKSTVVGFSAGKLQGVATAFRSHYPDLKIVICGDEDQWKLSPRGRPYHTGRRAAKQSARVVAGSICQVSFGNLDADTLSRVRPTDFNDLHVHCGLTAVKRQIENHYETAPHEYIATEHTGFFEEKMTRQGPKHEAKPMDLYQHFQRHNTLVACEGKVYEYRRGVYEEISPHVLKSYAQEHYVIDEEKAANRYLRDEFVALAQTEANVTTDWWDESTEGFINFENGLMNKETGELVPHSSEKGFRFQLKYPFKPDQKAPVWEKMLSIVTQNDEKLANLLEEYVGYALSNDPIWEHKALMLIGDGANGKSTFINTVAKLLGEENTAAVSVSGLSSETRRDMIFGKLAILCEENNIKNFDSDHFKNIVGGGRTDARALYKNPYQFNNRAKMIVAFNNFDRVTDLSHGLFRRLLLAPFNHTFKDGEADKHIEEKLERELPGIFNRCWAAYSRMKARGGFEEVPVVRAAVELLKHDSDVVLQFIEDTGLKPWDGKPVNGETPPPWGGKQGDGTPFVISDEIYSEFRTWADRSGVVGKYTKTKFGRRLLGALNAMEGNKFEVESRTISRGGKKARGFVGVDWRGVSDY